MNTDLVKYYKERAAEYEQIYFKPERQEDIKKTKSLLRDHFENRNLLEIACGTGYWTECIAEKSGKILATDINAEVLEIACQKNYSRGNVEFLEADLYSYPFNKKFDNLFGGFIWSHILLQDLPAFLRRAGELVKPGGKIVFMDNRFVAGSNHPITNTDENGNTYQTRKLSDGSSHKVLKNFPARDFLVNKVHESGTPINCIELDYFWILAYTNKPPEQIFLTSV